MSCASPSLVPRPMSKVSAPSPLSSSSPKLQRHQVNNNCSALDLKSEPERCLRPWVLLGSSFLFILGAMMIIFTFVNHGTIGTMWGLFMSGFIYIFLSFLGFLAGTTLRTRFTGLFCGAMIIGWIVAMIAMITNVILLHRHLLVSNCGVFSKESIYCQRIREYHIITYCALGVPAAIWVPILIVVSGYFWKYTLVLKKETNQQLSFSSSSFL
eukprot:TRINITY_DN2103_c0_g1_i1.p1 TRINITY_DN2103_c0_g1~~TRINITY_DN2103_c0_g1_i1.p1  ORF type:complete len:212 (+),score=16.32 TRINITY_DN2103_c0_g1_i1:195-830(+)